MSHKLNLKVGEIVDGFKYIGDMEMPKGGVMPLFNAPAGIDGLIENSTYALPTLQKKGFLKSLSNDGLSKGLTPEEIANKHGVSYNQIVSELMDGIDIEMEHTPDKKEAKQIAMDHLTEDPKYYTKLKKAGL